MLDEDPLLAHALGTNAARQQFSRVRAATVSDSGHSLPISDGCASEDLLHTAPLETIKSIRLPDKAASSSDLRELRPASCSVLDTPTAAADGPSAAATGPGAPSLQRGGSGMSGAASTSFHDEIMGASPKSRSPMHLLRPQTAAAIAGAGGSGSTAAAAAAGSAATGPAAAAAAGVPFVATSAAASDAPPGTPTGALPQQGSRTHAPTAAGSGALPPDLQPFWEYLSAEANPLEKVPTADVVWRQTERDRVYNYLMYVPYQLERLMWIGTLLCLTSFLASLTLVPLRCLRGLCSVFASRGRPSCGCRLLPGHQLYDVVSAILLVSAAACLTLLRPGIIYFWMKDITSEFLKIQVLFNALEILDKILSNFGVDVLEALSGTCTLYSRRRIGAFQLASDAAIALLLVTAHAAVLMCEAILFSVAMNSARHALLALLIAANFVELKGQVYKRTDTSKLWALACMDIVERFHLLVVLSFVVAEDVSNSGSWLPAGTTVVECARIFGWEIAIDITKHAVLGKFNDIRPGIYREYTRDLCQDLLAGQSNSVHKLVGFFPLGPAALTIRMIFSLFWLRPEHRIGLLGRSMLVLLLWLGLCVLQPLLGYAAKIVACAYVMRHNAAQGGKPGPRVIHVKDLGSGTTSSKANVGAAAAGTAASAANFPAAHTSQTPTGGRPKAE